MPPRLGAAEKEGDSQPGILLIAAFASFGAFLVHQRAAKAPQLGARKGRVLQASFPAETSEVGGEGCAWGGKESRAAVIGLLMTGEPGTRVALEPQ